MAELLCPKCAKPSNGLCADCWIAKHPISVKVQSFKECECELGYFKGEWYRDFDEMIEEIVKKSLVPPENVRIKAESIDYKEKAGQIELSVKVSGTYNKKTFHSTVEWKIKAAKTKCEPCRKAGSGYYEAILQVRDKNLRLDIDDKQLTSINEVKGGYDMQIVSGEYAREKTNSLIEQGYLITASTTLFGQREGKDIYRFYYSIKHPPFYGGDIVLHKGRLMQVMELGKITKLRDLITNKITSASASRVAEAEIIAKKDNLRKAFITEIRPDGMQIMDEIDYKTHDIAPKDGLNASDKIEYIIYKNKVILI